MNLSKNGEAIVKNFEGLRLNSYRDTAGTWTTGYGSTQYQDGKHIKPGDRLSDEAMADALLHNTLGQYIEAVNKYVRVPLNQNQFDALVSFTYNEGTGALEKSTLLSRLNEKNYNGAANQFLVWDKITDVSTGKKTVCNTLSERRRKERLLFLSNDK